MKVYDIVNCGPRHQFAVNGKIVKNSAKGLQPHNMRRECFNTADTERLKECMRQGRDLSEATGLSVMDSLVRLLRPCIIPAKGKKFVVGDWSSIEARVLPWLSDSAGGEHALDVFRDGRDVYMETAASMGLTGERQLGKVANLSLGFGGAVGAFNAMAKNYGVELPEHHVRTIVDKWRHANPWARTFWNALEQAARKAVRHPSKVFAAGRIRYVFVAGLLGGTLMCILPNDTVIQYPYARLESDGVTAMKGSLQPKADSDDEWPRMRLWGGFLAENCTQATAACLLKEALRDLVRDGFPVVGHVHDEVILESNDEDVETDKRELQEYLELAPSWAKGLPLTAVPEVFDRYGK